jgi:hypothetical protein
MALLDDIPQLKPCRKYLVRKGSKWSEHTRLLWCIKDRFGKLSRTPIELANLDINNIVVLTA